MSVTDKIADRIAEQISKSFGLCGYGEEQNWSVRVADYFFVDCGCCWFWRGVAFGTFIGIVFSVINVSIYLLLKGQ